MSHEMVTLVSKANIAPSTKFYYAYRKKDGTIGVDAISAVYVRFVLYIMADMAPGVGDPVAWPSAETIAKRTSISRKTVTKILWAMEQNGLIKPRGRLRRGTMKWELNVEMLEKIIADDGAWKPMSAEEARERFMKRHGGPNNDPRNASARESTWEVASQVPGKQLPTTWEAASHKPFNNHQLNPHLPAGAASQRAAEKGHGELRSPFKPKTQASDNVSSRKSTRATGPEEEYIKSARQKMWAGLKDAAAFDRQQRSFLQWLDLTKRQSDLLPFARTFMRATGLAPVSKSDHHAWMATFLAWFKAGFKVADVEKAISMAKERGLVIARPSSINWALQRLKAQEKKAQEMQFAVAPDDYDPNAWVSEEMF